MDIVKLEKLARLLGSDLESISNITEDRFYLKNIKYNDMVFNLFICTDKCYHVKKEYINIGYSSIKPNISYDCSSYMLGELRKGISNINISKKKDPEVIKKEVFKRLIDKQINAIEAYENEYNICLGIQASSKELEKHDLRQYKDFKISVDRDSFRVDLYGVHSHFSFKNIEQLELFNKLYSNFLKSVENIKQL